MGLPKAIREESGAITAKVAEMLGAGCTQAEICKALGIDGKSYRSRVATITRQSDGYVSKKENKQEEKTVNIDDDCCVGMTIPAARRIHLEMRRKSLVSVMFHGATDEQRSELRFIVAVLAGDERARSVMRSAS